MANLRHTFYEVSAAAALLPGLEEPAEEEPPPPTEDGVTGLRSPDEDEIWKEGVVLLIKTVL